MGYRDWPWDIRSGHLGQPYSSLECPKVCVHTTETRGFPNYDWPPHITYDIANDRGRWHVPADKAAYALRGGTPSSNKDAGPVFQIEVVAYAKDSPSQSDEWYARLSALLTEVCGDLGVPKVIHPSGFVQTGAYGPNGVMATIGHHGTRNRSYVSGPTDRTIRYPAAAAWRPRNSTSCFLNLHTPTAAAA